MLKTLDICYVMIGGEETLLPSVYKGVVTEAPAKLERYQDGNYVVSCQVEDVNRYERSEAATFKVSQENIFEDVESLEKRVHCDFKSMQSRVDALKEANNAKN
jgi:hypothetical protein